MGDGAGRGEVGGRARWRGVEWGRRRAGWSGAGRDGKVAGADAVFCLLLTCSNKGLELGHKSKPQTSLWIVCLEEAPHSKSKPFPFLSGQTWGSIRTRRQLLIEI